MSRITSLVVVVSLLTANAYGAPVEVDVPSYPVWCVDQRLNVNSSSGNDIFADSINVFAAQAQQQKLATIGFPFATSIAPEDGGTAGKDYVLTVCAAVPSDAKAPGGRVTATMEPARKGVGDMCDRASMEACVTTLRSTLSGAPWNVKDDPAKPLIMRTHLALSSDHTADNLVKSIASSNDVTMMGGAVASTTNSLAVLLLIDATDLTAPTTSPPATPPATSPSAPPPT